VRPLTLKGFLKRYLQELSEAKTIGIFTLAKLAYKDNPRLRYPLYLYARESGKLKIFNSARKLYPFEVANDGKTLQTFEYYQNKAENDNHTKLLMYNRIIALQKQKNVSNYRIYTDLALNPGNANAFLKYGDISKCGLSLARHILDYLERV